MNENEKPFDDLLNELIRMYRRLRDSDKTKDVEIDGDFEFLINHYQNIKSKVDEEMLIDMGGPLKEMLESLLGELRKELGDDAADVHDAVPEQDVIRDAVAKIDEKLKTVNLSTKEINTLLDERSSLIAQVKTN